MAIPAGGFTAQPFTSPFIAPFDDAYLPLRMRVPGGIAIGDGSQGRDVQFWTVSYAPDMISIANAAGVVGFTLPVVGALSVSAAFDANMSPNIAYMKAGGAYLYFYDSLAGAYSTLLIAAANDCRVCVDKTTQFFEAASDVIFAYLKDGNVYFRVQRERFAVEHLIGPAVGTLVRVGPNQDNRLQFEIAPF